MNPSARMFTVLIPALLVFLHMSALASSREGLLVQFDESGHRITRVLNEKQSSRNRSAAQRIPTLKAVRGSARRGNDRIAVKLMYRHGAIEVLELADPRVLRAPMRADGGGHEAIVQKKRGAYVIPVPDSDSILDIEITLPDLNDKGYRRLP